MGSLFKYPGALLIAKNEYRNPWNNHQNNQNAACRCMRYFQASENMKGYFCICPAINLQSFRNCQRGCRRIIVKRSFFGDKRFSSKKETPSCLEMGFCRKLNVSAYQRTALTQANSSLPCFLFSQASTDDSSIFLSFIFTFDLSAFNFTPFSVSLYTSTLSVL